MATETLQQKQQRFAADYQALMQQLLPQLDFGAGSALYEFVVKPSAMLWAEQDLSLDTLRANFSLTQALQSASPNDALVDLLLSNLNVFRRPGVSATGTINVYASSPNPLFVALGTVFTCGSVTLQPTQAYVLSGLTGSALSNGTLAAGVLRQLPDGTWVGSVPVKTVLPTTAVLSPGQVCTSTLPAAAVLRAEIGTAVVGGTLPETTAALLQRAATGLNARVVTGRANIQSLLTQGDLPVLDLAVFGMGDQLQQRDRNNSGQIGTGGRVDLYITTAPVPVYATVTCTAVKQADGSWSLTLPDEFNGAYGVLQVSHAGKTDNIPNVLSSLACVANDDPLVRTVVDARYSIYQRLRLVFDDAAVGGIAGDLLDYDCTVLYMPRLADVQAYLLRTDVRSYAFDTLVRAVVPVLLSPSLEIDYPVTVTPPTVAALQQAVADVINGKPIGTPVLFASELVHACKQVFPDGVVRTPLDLLATVWMPDGTQAFARDTERIQVAEQPGLSVRNSSFFCYPNQVTITLTAQA